MDVMPTDAHRGLALVNRTWKSDFGTLVHRARFRVTVGSRSAAFDLHGMRRSTARESSRPSTRYPSLSRTRVPPSSDSNPRPRPPVSDGTSGLRLRTRRLSGLRARRLTRRALRLARLLLLTELLLPGLLSRLLLAWLPLSGLLLGGLLPATLLLLTLLIIGVGHETSLLCAGSCRSVALAP